MIVIGLSGGIASGKSTFARLLVEQGAVLIDADIVARELMSSGAAAYWPVVEHFGQGILGESSEIDRAALGQIVFKDPAALAVLDGLVHPQVVIEIRQRLGTMDADVVIIEAIKLYESGLDRLCDEVWVVICDQEQQIRRLVEERGLSEADATARVAAQADSAERAARADLVITNNGSLAQLAQEANSAYESLLGRYSVKCQSSMVWPWLVLSILGGLAIVILAPESMRWGQRILASLFMAAVFAAAFALMSLERGRDA